MMMGQIKMKSQSIDLLLKGYVCLIIMLVVLPMNSSGSSINHTFVLSFRLDYLLHGLLFVPLMGLLRLRFRSGRIKSFLLWLPVALLFAMLCEGIQYALPYRAYNINDMVANGLGVLIGALAWFVPFRWFSWLGFTV